AYDVDGTPLFTGQLPTTGIPYLKVGFNYRYMTDAEVTHFFESIDRSTIKGRRDFCLFLAYFICARRRSELVSLRFRDLEQTVIVGNDGTRHDGWVYRFQGAKGHARRVFTFEMPEIVIKHILDYLTFAGRIKTIQPDDPVFAPLFPGQGRRDSKKNEPLSGNYINGLFRQYCAKAGLDSRFTLHSLRHSSARARYKAGASLQSIQHLLLHSNIGITDLYLRTLAGVADPEARLLEQWFSHLGKL
ncbi:MAG TPA: tyrosine-type recombinase/integrase, partial [Ktedonobacteraceae bacterium]|nr:tyrosine-type recombinase/integrase [Ktedonobacteraceae bacterium]